MHRINYEEDYDKAGSSSDPANSSTPSASPTSSPPDSTFECNVCFDTPTDPVVTPCGHLYCWSCLYRWMRLHPESPQCPVCKSSVDKRTVIPIYGRGLAERDPRNSNNAEEEVPPRPQGHRAQPPSRPQGVRHGPAFGMHHAAFGRINPYAAANYENVSLSTFGLFPSLFGLQIAYPHVNEPPRDDTAANQEDGTSEQVSKVFLLLTLFIAIIITTF